MSTLVRLSLCDSAQFRPRRSGLRLQLLVRVLSRLFACHQIGSHCFSGAGNTTAKETKNENTISPQCLVPISSHAVSLPKKLNNSLAPNGSPLVPERSLANTGGE